MFGFGDDDHQAVYGGEHQAKFSHELIAGAASFEAMKLFEDRQRREGKPVSHAFAKEALAGLAGGEVDKLFETRGLDYLDRDQVQNRAVEQAQYNYDQHYGGYDEWHPQQAPRVEYNNYNYGDSAPYGQGW
jgi:hypothetical protein